MKVWGWFCLCCFRVRVWRLCLLFRRICCWWQDIRCWWRIMRVWSKIMWVLSKGLSLWKIWMWWWSCVFRIRVSLRSCVCLRILRGRGRRRKSLRRWLRFLRLWIVNWCLRMRSFWLCWRNKRMRRRGRRRSLMS